jgi:hypothetical protein
MSQVEGTEFASPYCKHHLLKIAEGNRCKHWSVYLHNWSLGCSVQSRERDNTIECLPTVGCREWSRTASAVQPESVQSSDNDDSFLNIDEDHDDQSSIQRGSQKSIIFAESDSSDDLVIKSVDAVAKVWTSFFQFEG